MMRLPVCALLAFAAVWAQESPIISVNTRLVEVDVVVTNDKGPVKGLTQDDFTVFDQGKRQKIAAFSVKTPETSPRPPAFPETPGAVSNRASGSGTTIVLYDMLNTPDTEAGKPSAPQAFGRLQLVKYLRTLEAGQNESFALFTLLKSVKVVQDFTRDPQQLVLAGERLSPEQSADQGAEDLGADLIANASDLHDATANEMYKNAVREMQDFSRKTRASVTVEALRAIAKRLQGMPGRKKLIWLSSGFPAATFDQRTRNGQSLIEEQEFGREINHAIRDLNDANIGVYPIDPRDPYNAGLGADGIDTLNLLATGTGGKAFYSLTDLADAIRQSVNDTQVTYTLSFYPSDVKADGAFHALSVEVARRGVEVRARKGYFAPDAKPVTAKQLQQTMREILSTPVNATGLALSVRAVPEKSSTGTYNVDVTFDPHELHLERANNTWVALLALTEYMPGAQKPNGHQDAIKVTLTDARLREVLMAGRYTIRRPVHFSFKKPGDLRIALEDRVTGVTGSVQLRVTPN
jgi:VWFA-related protein